MRRNEHRAPIASITSPKRECNVGSPPPAKVTQSACPSRAIVFGDAADDDWNVTTHIANERAYHVFEELNTFTAVVYLKKINHPASAGATA